MQRNAYEKKHIGRRKTPYDRVFNYSYLLVILVTFALSMLILFEYQYEFQNLVLEILFFFHMPQGEFLCTLRQSMDFVGNSVWTLTTILSAFVAFYYSSLGYRNYGMANRSIISFRYGTGFIPALVAFNALIVAMMTGAYYLEWHTGFYFLAVYSCCIQAALMCFCVLATTQYNTAETIINVEKRQFYSLYGYRYYVTEKYIKKDKRGKKSKPDQEEFVYYLQYILSGEEEFWEKKEIIRSILLMPYTSRYLIFNENTLLLYQRQYKNFSLLAEYAVKKTEDASDIYELLYAVMDEIFTALDKNTMLDDKQMKEGIYISYSALCNAFLTKNALPEKWVFVLYLMNSKVRSIELRKELTVELLMIIQYLEGMGKLSLDDVDEMREIEKCFRKIEIENGFSAYIENIFGRNKDTEIRKILRKVTQLWSETTSLDKAKSRAITYEIEANFYKPDKMPKNRLYHLVYYLIHNCLGGRAND